ncbi:hypothetical protein F4779DRAFT_641712 [Xylariaceae sp. FL0662B]|nr:hypothetical protein F4779DRAFT_641712 [Xylariaceae sp. FL0662B]
MSEAKKPQQPTATDDHCADHKRQVWNIDKKQDRPKLRWAFLIGLTAIIIAVLVVGVVFTVYYDTLYYTSGAFLIKEKGGSDAPEMSSDRVLGDAAVASTTTRAVNVFEAAAENGMIARSSKRERRRSTHRNICGEHQDSCEAYDQPNICCAVGTVCHPTDYSPSGIYCCQDGTRCHPTESRPPRCDAHSAACNRSLGGGCCAPGSECSPAGCLKIYRAAPGLMSSSSSSTTRGPSTTESSAAKPTASATSSETAGITVTTPKLGETAQSGGALRGIRPGFGFSSCLFVEEVALALALAIPWAMVFRDG